MEYTVHEWKKTLRKNRMQIAIGVLLIGFICMIVWLAYPSQKVEISNPNIPSDPSHQEDNNTTETPILTKYSIVKTYDRKGIEYFTQGLTFKDPQTLVETTGLRKKSVVHLINLANMEILKEQKLDDMYFGEGCEIITINGKTEIFQLTWREGKILVWDADTLELKRTENVPAPIREGWGLTKRIEVDSNDKKTQYFYYSDGSSNIYVIDPETLKIKKTIEVVKRDGTRPEYLNELEFINGKIWANIWLSNEIAVINPDSGLVESFVNLKGLGELAKKKSQELGRRWDSGNNVLNGIAYDEQNDRLIVTGKNWPFMWEIKVEGI